MADSNVVEELTSDEVAEVQKVLKAVYGEQALNWNVSLKTYNLLGELILRSDQCSRFMDVVPRPYSFGDPLKYARKQVRAALTRSLLHKSNEHYLSCLTTVGASMKTQFAMAGMDL